MSIFTTRKPSMVRYEMRLSEDQRAEIRRMAREQGLTVRELIMRALDHYRRETQTEARRTR